MLLSNSQRYITKQTINMGNMKSKTFYRITNKEIYEEIQGIKKEITKLTIKTNVNAAIVAVVVSVAVVIVSRII